MVFRIRWEIFLQNGLTDRLVRQWFLIIISIYWVTLESKFFHKKLLFLQQFLRLLRIFFYNNTNYYYFFFLYLKFLSRKSLLNARHLFLEFLPEMDCGIKGIQHFSQRITDYLSALNPVNINNFCLIIKMFKTSLFYHNMFCDLSSILIATVWFKKFLFCTKNILSVLAVESKVWIKSKLCLYNTLESQNNNIGISAF